MSLASLHHPGEFPYSTTALEDMAARLRAGGHLAAAAETEELLAVTRAYMETARARADRLRGVWSAAEAEDPRALQDAAAAHGKLKPLAPAAPRPAAWQTVIPGRRPEKKAHTTLGHAKSAIRNTMWRAAQEDMVLLELDPATGTYTTLFVIPQGTTKDQLPW